MADVSGVWRFAGGHLRHALFAIHLLALPLVAIGATEPRRLPGIPEQLGCLHYNYGYTPLNTGVNVSTLQNTSLDCQRACRESVNPNCNFFTFWEAYHRCDFALDGAVLMPTLPENPGVSGPATCLHGRQSPVCTDLPSNAFPGATAADSAAAWPHSEVPTNAQCWPRDPWTGYPVPCTPMTVTVLEDTADDWPGKCMDLDLQDVPPGMTCKDLCLKNVLCSVWQEVNYTNPPQCWQGHFGHECYTREGFRASASQRVMHGTYRVLKDLTGIDVKGLSQMFTTAVFKDLKRAAAKCRLYCIAQLACQYWIYSKVSGCWVEDAWQSRVAYPLTKDPAVSQNNTDLAQAVVAGEYIQHYCDGNAPSAGVVAALAAKPTTTTTSTTSRTTVAPAVPITTLPWQPPVVPVPTPAPGSYGLPPVLQSTVSWLCLIGAGTLACVACLLYRDWFRRRRGRLLSEEFSDYEDYEMEGYSPPTGEFEGHPLLPDGRPAGVPPPYPGGY